jgi:L-cysteine:1D-myo-inositol 2-amino-2-deoxy-alpha-D-glucopyranoside ligase
LELFDTAARTMKPFPVGQERVVRLYTCGITPYDASHVGHAKVYLTYDVLARRLEDLGYEVRCVRNVTDVDDDILAKARSMGVNYLDLALHEMRRFDEVMAALNVGPPWSSPRASSAIPEIQLLIARLLERGHAYQVGSWVYFDVTTVDYFGRLSKLEESEMIRLAAERGGHPEDPNKRHPLDFVLWQPSAPDEPSWESRFGAGRPGWHVECAALAVREHEGMVLDLHGGGADLLFPHHECEAAQVRAAYDRELARHWAHVGMVHYQGEKMSKSLGNLVFVHDLLSKYEPMAIRLALLLAPWHEDWEYSDDLVKRGVELLRLFSKAAQGEGDIEGVRYFLDRDLDTASAIGFLEEEARAGRPVRAGLRLLGVEL